METIVVGVDGSLHSEAALRWALDEARLRHAGVRAVHVWEPGLIEPYPYTSPSFDPQAVEAAARRRLGRTVDAVVGHDTDVEVEQVTPCGSPASTLIEQAKAATLLVVGSRGRGGFAGLILGSVSGQLAQHAPCPVVIIHA